MFLETLSYTVLWHHKEPDFNKRTLLSEDTLRPHWLQLFKNLELFWLTQNHNNHTEAPRKHIIITFSLFSLIAYCYATHFVYMITCVAYLELNIRNRLLNIERRFDLPVGMIPRARDKTLWKSLGFVTQKRLSLMT